MHKLFAIVFATIIDQATVFFRYKRKSLDSVALICCHPIRHFQHHAWPGSLVVLNQGEDVDAGEFLAAVEEGELDGEGCAFDDAAELLDEFYSGGGGASGGEQIVADDDALAGFHGVFMNFEGVRAVLQRVGNAGGLGGELLWLANGNKAGAEPIGQSGGENEAARLDSRNDINRVTLVVFAEAVDEEMESLFVFQKRGQVVKENPRLRVIGHFADQLLQVVHSNASSRLDSLRYAHFNNRYGR